MTTVKDRKIFAMALVLVALMSIFVPIVSAVSQTWYLCTGEKMYKTAPSDCTVVISDNSDACWDAGQAQCDLTIGAGTWPLHLNYNAPSVGGTIDIELWSGDHGADVLFGSVDNEPISGGSGTISVDISGSEVYFPTDNYLMLFIKWDASSGTTGLTVNCGNGKSTFTSPSTDPGYPVPELSTMVLFSVGLLALVGYVGYRRRRI